MSNNDDPLELTPDERKALIGAIAPDPRLRALPAGTPPRPVEGDLAKLEPPKPRLETVAVVEAGHGAECWAREEASVVNLLSYAPALSIRIR